MMARKTKNPIHQHVKRMLMKNPKTKNQYPAYAAQYSDDGKKNQMIQTL